MAGLIDQFGNTISPTDIARLRDRVAGPTLAGVRQVFSASPADGMTPGRLARIHRAAAEGDSLAYMELAEDIEERDMQYAAVLGTRKRSVAQLPIQVEAASEDPEHEEHARFLTDWIDTGVMEEALETMLDAVGKGYSVHEIEWDVGPDGILPRELTYRTPRWFEVSRGDGETVLLRDLALATLNQTFPGVEQSLDGLPYPGQVGLVPLAPHKFVVHKSRAKAGILLRAGLARIASWAWMYRAFTMRDWALFVQNYGQPMRVGRYGPESTEADRDTLWRAVSNIAGDCAAIIPKSMEIEFIRAEGMQAAAELYERRAEYFDRLTSKIVLGQTTTTDAVSGGHAVSKEHRLVQGDIERADARALSRTVSRQIAAPIIAFNFPSYVAKGGRAFPRISIGRPDELPLEEITKALQWLGPQGLTVAARQVRERMGFDEPEDGEDVVGGKPPPPPPPAPTVTPAHVARTAEDPRGAGPDPGGAGAAKAGAAKDGAGQAAHAVQLRTALSATVDPELLDHLVNRTALDTQGALVGLTDQVRAELDAATSLHDLVGRLTRLQLDPDAFQRAMQQALAVANLVGQSALLDELRRG